MFSTLNILGGRSRALVNVTWTNSQRHKGKGAYSSYQMRPLCCAVPWQVYYLCLQSSLSFGNLDHWVSEAREDVGKYRQIHSTARPRAQSSNPSIKNEQNGWKISSNLNATTYINKAGKKKKSPTMLYNLWHIHKWNYYTAIKIDADLRWQLQWQFLGDWVLSAKRPPSNFPSEFLHIHCYNYLTIICLSQWYWMMVESMFFFAIFKS